MMRNLFSLIAIFTILTPALAQQYQWAIPFGTMGFDAVTDIATGPGGRVYATGVFEGTMDVDPGSGVYNLVSAGGYDVFVCAYESSGSLIWAVKFGSTLYESTPRLVVDYDGNIIVAGGFRSTVDFDPGAGVFNLTSSGQLDLFFVKLHSAGGFIWAKSIGSSGDEEIGGLAVDNQNHIIASGLFTGTVDFDPNAGIQNLVSTGAQDAFILKWNTNGDYQWAYRFGTTQGEFCYDVQVDASGNVYATGLFYGNMDFDPGAGAFMLNAGFFDSQAYALKWTGEGNFLWAVMFGGSLSDSAYSLALDEAANVYITGYFAGTGDFDPGAGVFNMDGGSNSSFPDIFVLKLNTNAGFVWARSAGATNTNQQGYGINWCPQGQVYITGLFAGTVDFDPGLQNYPLTASGSSDGYVWGLSAAGDFVYAGRIGGSQSDYGNTIHCGAGALYAGGVFSWSGADLDPGSGEALFTSASFTNDGYLVKLGICEPPTLSISATHFQCGGGTATVQVAGNGPFTYQWNDSQQQTSATAMGLNEGTYTVTVTDAQGCTESASVMVPPHPCPADFNGDGLVNVSDLLVFMAAFGGSGCPYDMDNNEVINVTDLLTFMTSFGVFCPN